jgi:hypothetical protein
MALDGVKTLHIAARRSASSSSPVLMSEAVTDQPSAASPIACVPIPQAQSRIAALLSKPCASKIPLRKAASSRTAACQSR